VYAVICLQDIQSQRAEQLGSPHPRLAVVSLVRSLALVQLGEKQRAQQELAAARQMLDSIKQQQQQQQAGGQQQEGLQQAQQMYDRVGEHIARCCYQDGRGDGCC
jgi:hypothetical protein